MLLRAIEIQNFRSLEDVSLQGLSGFNVLIGRNSVGKSAIFGAISYLANYVFGRGMGSPQDSSILTDHDESRQFGVTLTLTPNDDERAGFVDSLVRIGLPEDRRQSITDSPLIRQMKYEFQASPGQPWNPELLTVSILAEDHLWVQIYSAFTLDGPPNRINPHRLMSIARVIQEDVSAPISASRIASKWSQFTINFSDSSVVKDYRRHADTWAIAVILEYFSSFYFFWPISPRRKDSASRSTREALVRWF